LPWRPPILTKNPRHGAGRPCYTLASCHRHDECQGFMLSRHATLLLLCLLLLSACGQKGPLYLPETPPVAADEDEERD